MFWDHENIVSKKFVHTRPLQPGLRTGWASPKMFPNLASARVLSICVFTSDPDMMQGVPGWGRGIVYLTGVSIGSDTGQWYFPIHHEAEPETNLDKKTVLSWLRTILRNASQPKVGAGLTDAVGWLAKQGVWVAGELIDINFAESLLCEDAIVDIDGLVKKYLNYESDLNRYQKYDVHRLPPRCFGSIAEEHVCLFLRIIREQYKLLRQYGLLKLFDMECRLIRLMILIRREGVSIDISKAERYKSNLVRLEVIISEKIKNIVGFDLNVNSSSHIVKAFGKTGLSNAMRSKSSFTQDFFMTINHPLADLILKKRKYVKLRVTFIESYILNSNINGKIYNQYNQLRCDGVGTRSGRFSSSNPNLQNVPLNIREVFVPDPGHKTWVKHDYNQIEYRFLAHFAVGTGALELRSDYKNNPYTDYHVKTQRLIFEKTGKKLSRNKAKSINFGLIYGMGRKTLSENLKLSYMDSKKLFSAYHHGLPFVESTIKASVDECNATGMIKTVLGRRSRFVRREDTYKALNRRLQGSSADMLKVGMLKCYESGVFDVTGVPRITVHDELDFSDPGGCDEAFLEIKNIMETCIPLKVPVVVDVQAGPNWGNLNDKT